MNAPFARGGGKAGIGTVVTTMAVAVGPSLGSGLASSLGPSLAPALGGTAVTVGSRITAAVAARIAVGVAASIGVAFGGASAAWAGLQHQAKLATERIGISEVPPPRRDGIYLPDGSYVMARRRRRRPLSITTPVVLVMLGDSASAGFGAADEDGVPGVMLARRIAAELGRPVRLSTHAVVGSGAADLQRQLAESLQQRPDLAVVIVGANDVRDRVSPAESAAKLTSAVRELRSRDIAVVVGTCPDLGVIAPIPQPLRQLAGYWSRSLAARQEQAVEQAGGIAVPIGRLVSPGFAGHPELFSADLFHPSAAGYAKAVEALLPAARDALGIPVRTEALLQPDAQLLG